MLACSLSVLVASITTAPAAAADLRDQLQALAGRHGFTIEHLERVGDAPAREVEGDVALQLERLLDDFNFVLVAGPTGAIERVLISSAKSTEPRVARRVVVPLRRAGAHHLASAVLIGPRGEQRSMALMIDTGATTVVLPDTMIPLLGFAESDLRDGHSQTANGRIAVKRGILSAMRVGNASTQDVEVNFVPAARLGRRGLLGMSFLRQFRFTIDDERDELIMQAK